MAVAVVAEKPAVALDIAKVLGATQKQDGAWHGRGYVVTWAVGHLVGLAEPQEIDPAWKPWVLGRLPMIPSHWPLKVLDSAHKQFQIVRRILNDSSVDRVICATDAGREGELIFRYIYRLAKCSKPVARLWVSSLTADALREGFLRLRPAREFDALADSAEGRSRADWLVGMNLTRAYTLTLGGDLFSVGRVQTPTLAMIVEREKAIRDFVPEPYCEVRAQFGGLGSPPYPASDCYWGVWFDPARSRKREGESVPPQRLPADGQLAEAIRQRCLNRQGKVLSLQGTDKSFPPPLLHDLTELQRQANRLYGLTAGATLAAAQTLYEKHKLISYPRTDSRHLSTAVAATLQPIVDSIAPAYGALVAPGSGRTPLSKRYVDDAKVSDHHAIIPTETKPGSQHLSRDEQRVYDLVCRRLLMAWHAEHKTRTTHLVTEVRSEEATDLFGSTGTVVLQAGWKVLEVQTSRSNEEPLLPSALKVGQERPVLQTEVQNKQTTPPKRFTDATLLTAMESAGKCLDDRELEQAMRERGLGTPATRASILETLLDREYLRREGKVFHATDKGIALIDAVHEKVKSPAMTGEWEYLLKKVERKEESLAVFLAGIEQYVKEVVGEIEVGAKRSAQPTSQTAISTPQTQTPAPAVPQSPPTVSSNTPKPEATTPVPASAVLPTAEGVRPTTREIGEVLHTVFHHERFRPYQEEVVRAVTEGHDALVVMPTGSGKSLCYQVPGIARGGTTLIISPLIALMEDQTAKLNALGLAADRIHSGRPRQDSREACRAWLRGDLQFLMIAPERLSVPGFPEMLARRKPTLIAIDEAHCISHWGHDFRPDYRLLGDRIPLLRPAPIVALTATATVRVQDDILQQLSIPQAQRFIRGFRRDNLAVEIAEVPPAARLGVTHSLLADPARRPAIVYVPTRKAAEDYASTLARKMRAAAYHAGRPPEDRGRVQDDFLAGDLEVVVATIAFGMGVDKPDVRTVVHAALPGTVEGYYQEIGRAGRDGKPSRAILMFSYADRRIHDSFLERDYPPAEVLREIHAAIPRNGLERELLTSHLRRDPEQVRIAIDKLWIHSGVRIDEKDWVYPLEGDWERSYEDIRAHRAEQLDLVFDFAQSGGCRMLRLVRHFGDRDDRRLCEVCDECAPEACCAKRSRAPTPLERTHLVRILEALFVRDGLAAGTLHRQVFGEQEIDRNTFEEYLDGMVRSKVVAALEETFEKDGKVIKYRRIHLRARGSAETLAADVRLQDRIEAAAVRPKKGRKTRARPGPDLLVSSRIGPARTGARRKSKPQARTGDESSSKRTGKERERTIPGARQAPVDPGASPAAASIVARLRAWRLGLAAQKRIPAFRILTDQALVGIAMAAPRTEQALLQVKGVGPRIVERYGGAILALVGTGK